MDEVVRGGCGRTAMRRKPQKKEATVRQRQIFLETLADSCNVCRAAAAAGITKSTFYRLRRRDDAFAEAWQAALESGYARLEMALVERAIYTIEGAGGDDVDPLPAVGAMTVAQAIDLLAKHRASVASGHAKGMRPSRRNRPTAEETDAEILRRIAIIERQRAGKASKSDAA